jgi:hypothetical protein
LVPIKIKITGITVSVNISTQCCIKKSWRYTVYQHRPNIWHPGVGKMVEDYNVWATLACIPHSTAGSQRSIEGDVFTDFHTPQDLTTMVHSFHKDHPHHSHNSLAVYGYHLFNFAINKCLIMFQSWFCMNWAQGGK